MSDEGTDPHHHDIRERLDAARAAAEEVVAEEGGQLGGEVSALAVPLEEIAAAVRAAIHPHGLAKHEVVENAPSAEDEPAGDGDTPAQPPASE
jgi:phosphoserine phosphatase